MYFREKNSRKAASAAKSQAFRQGTLGYKQLKDGHYEDAIIHFTEAIRLNPKDYILFFNRGRAQEHLEHYQEAIEDYTENLRLSGGRLHRWH